MTGMTLFAAILAVGVCVFTVLCVVAVRPAELLPSTVDPYATPVPADPAADTLPTGQGEVTLNGDWHQVELSRLCDAERLLDTLEARNVQHREMSIVANDKFVVRWR
jgi:hypothetical protein